MNQGDLTLQDCVFDGNSAVNVGGAVSANGATVLIERTRIVNNQAAFGGGLFFLNSAVTIKNSFINSNSLIGIGCNSSSIDITLSSISNNSLPDVSCNQWYL